MPGVCHMGREGCEGIDVRRDSMKGEGGRAGSRDKLESTVG